MDDAAVMSLLRTGDQKNTDLTLNPTTYIRYLPTKHPIRNTVRKESENKLKKLVQSSPASLTSGKSQFGGSLSFLAQAFKNKHQQS